MSTKQEQDEETPATALEAQIAQFQTTFNSLWQKIKIPEDPVPERLVVWGKEYQGQTLSSTTVSNAIESRIHFTYRSGFQSISRAENGPGPLSFLGSMLFNAIPNTTVAGVLDNQHFTTDVGWGCMIRTSQSLLANTLQTLVLGRDYCYDGRYSKLDSIVKLFADNYSSPFSLHNFIKVASESPLQVKPGEWFGPSAASLSIKRLCDRYQPGDLPQIRVVISESCDLYEDEIKAHFSSSAQPILMLFPIRLGIESVNEYYHPSLLQILTLRQFVGIAGGKPSSSYYFFGYQDLELLYLDPHNLQTVATDGSTYHTTRCRSLPISALDPSMLVGIALRDYDDYLDLRKSLVNANKIVHFHKGPKRRKSTADDDYVKVIIPDLEGELIDDFVNVSDHVSDTEVMGNDEDPPSEWALTESPGEILVGKYDVVGQRDVS